MQAGFYKYRTLSLRLRAIKFGISCVGILSIGLSAQAATATDPPCFSINVRLNGQPIEGPQSVTLKTHKAEDTVSIDKSCFRVPDPVTQSELVEVSFTVPGSSIHMSDVPSDFLNGSWTLELADKKFPKDIAVPKHANASEICALVVHAGNSDQSFAQPQCRTPIASASK